jgi:hypothetical protein
MSIFTTGRPHCQCLYEIENKLPRTKFCRVACSDQHQILEERQHVGTPKNVIKLTQGIGWNPLFPETIKRLDYMFKFFRGHFTEEEISSEEIEKQVIYSIGRFGQGEVYTIYMQMIEEPTLNQGFKDFMNAFQEVVAFDYLKPRHYIDLFIEYLYSVHIKR